MLPFGKKKTHKSHIHYFTTLKGVVGMLRDPEHTESVFDIEDGLKDIEAQQLYVDYARQAPGVAQLMEERYIAEPHDMDRLRALPAGTLGRAFADHIIEHGFDPDYYRKFAVETDLDWVILRMRQTHDIWHVMTGIGTDPIGELSLKAFELAQTRRPMAAVITAGGVMRYMMKTPDELGSVLEGIAMGYGKGTDAAPFLAQKWEEGWDRPLDAWREELNVCSKEVPCGAFDPDEDEAIAAGA